MSTTRAISELNSRRKHPKCLDSSLASIAAHFGEVMMARQRLSPLRGSQENAKAAVAIRRSLQQLSSEPAVVMRQMQPWAKLLVNNHYYRLGYEWALSLKDATGKKMLQRLKLCWSIDIGFGFDIVYLNAAYSPFECFFFAVTSEGDGKRYAGERAAAQDFWDAICPGWMNDYDNREDAGDMVEKFANGARGAILGAEPEFMSSSPFTDQLKGDDSAGQHDDSTGCEMK